MNTSDTRRTGASMYMRLGATDVESLGQVSPLRRAGMLLLALLVVASMPMFWAASALGDESDEPAAALNKSGPGSDDDGDEADDDKDEATTDGNGRSDGAGDTTGTDGAGDTKGTKLTDQGASTKAASVTDGINDTRGTDGAGDTKGTKLTDQGPKTRNG